MLLDQFYNSILESFHRLFVIQNGKQDIERLINALEYNAPIRNLLDNNENGSLSTLFSPFHGGMVYPFNFDNIKKEYPLHPNLVRIFELASILENSIQKFELSEKEPTEKEKRMLLKTLNSFLKMLPTYEAFQIWCSS